MNLSQETTKELILTLLGINSEKQPQNSFYKVGSDYVIRTVTMIYLGQIKSEDETTITLEDCAWIPDTSRWSEFLQGKSLMRWSHTKMTYLYTKVLYWMPLN